MKEKNKKPTLEIFQNIIKILKENFYKASTKKKNKVLLYLKASVVIFILSPFTFFSVQAQIPIPEGEFENWTPASSGLYEEPTGGWWTTLNSLVQLGAAVTVSKTTDAYSGTYAAKLETKQWGTFMITGLLASGKFINTDPFVVQGKPFTDLPLKFQGYYKYTSINGDSAGIYAMLTKLNTTTGKRDTLADAKTAVKSTVPNYTEFDLNFKYYTPGVYPDSIDIVFCSSSGDSNRVGSVLFIDDVKLIYSDGLQECMMPEMKVNVYPNPVDENRTFTLSYSTLEDCNIEISVCDLIGRELFKSSEKTTAGSQVKEFSVTECNMHKGVYFISVKTADQLEIKKVMVL